MPIGLPPTLATLDDVEEPVKQFYEAGEDGVFKLTSIEALKNTSKNAKTERNAAIEKNKAYEAEVAKWKSLGATPEEIQDVMSKKSQFDEFDQTKGVEIAKIREDITRTYEGKLKAESTEKITYREAAEDTAREVQLERAYAAAGVNDVGKKFLGGDLAKHIKFEWQGNKPTMKLVGDDGKEMLNKETYDPLTLAELVGSYKTDAPFMFDSTFKKGGGSGASEGSKGEEAPANKKPVDWTFSEIKNYNLKHGDPEAFNKLVLQNNKG